ncbi:hypothetical protein FB45DRAFT_877684 [Roridomyces roridus]|uniref:Uncharacterized protein n=1 Tax=Roridomyces roridus TaxID=1738132 RepID=A0AAD7F7U4_9AGAR|nr:hypothetical protein FB45DRAFT_877684 [Roridomyces roridus]
MCDAVSSLKSSVILVALSLLPGAIASYTSLGLAVAAAVIYLGYRQIPSERLARLTSIIETTETQLKKAKSICARAMASLTEVEEQLLHAKRTASETKVRLLKIDEKEYWMEYLRTIREITQSIEDCGLDVKDIQTDILIIMEEETQRKISEGVGEARSVLATIHSVLPHVPRKIRRRRGAQSPDQSIFGIQHLERLAVLKCDYLRDSKVPCWKPKTSLHLQYEQPSLLPEICRHSGSTLPRTLRRHFLHWPSLRTRVHGGFPNVPPAPSERLTRLEARLVANSQLLDEAKEACRLRATRSLLELEERLLRLRFSGNFQSCLRGHCAVIRTKRAGSEGKIRLLKAEEQETWTVYLQTIREVMQTTSECGTDMKEIRTDVLVSTLILYAKEHR